MAEQETNITRMVAARQAMDQASAAGDATAFNDAFDEFDRIRNNSTRDEYLDLFPETWEET